MDEGNSGTGLIQRVFEFVKSFSSKAIIVGAIYLAGHFHISPLWLCIPITISVIRNRRNADSKLQHQIAIASNLNEEQLIITNICQLPAWVNFPDLERTEWFNKILSQMWPYISQYAMGLVKSSIEPSINEMLSAYVKESFKFEILSLGSVSPRINGLKVYKNNFDRKEIVMDFNVFYAGDCDFSFVFLSLKGGIQNFQVCGTLRVVMKPLIPTVPSMGGLDIFFLNKPNIEFNLIGVVDVLDMPGLSGKMRNIIGDQIAMIMVQPNKLHIPLTEEVYSPEFSSLEVEGVLCVNVIEAKNLENKDIGFFSRKDKSDPFVEVSVGEIVYTSDVIENSLNPEWEFWSEFIIESLYGDSLIIKVTDKDNTGRNPPLGHISVDIGLIKKKGHLDTWLELQDAKHGTIHLSLYFLILSSNLSDYLGLYESTELLRSPSSLLLVYIDSAQNLANPRSKKTIDSTVELTVGNSVQTSKTVSSNSPIFEEVFMFLVYNPEIDKLRVKLVDENSKTRLGTMSFGIIQVLNSKDMELLDRSYTLQNSASDSTVHLSLKLRVLKRK